MSCPICECANAKETVDPRTDNVTVMCPVCGTFAATDDVIDLRLLGDQKVKPRRYLLSALAKTTSPAL
jgi:hypothetical protein